MRIYELQVQLLIPTLYLINNKDLKNNRVISSSGYHLPADIDIDKKVEKLFEKYKNKWAHDKNDWFCKCGGLLKFNGITASCAYCKEKYLKKHNHSIEVVYE